MQASTKQKLSGECESSQGLENQEPPSSGVVPEEPWWQRRIILNVAGILDSDRRTLECIRAHGEGPGRQPGSTTLDVRGRPKFYCRSSAGGPTGLYIPQNGNAELARGSCWQRPSYNSSYTWKHRSVSLELIRGPSYLLSILHKAEIHGGNAVL